MKLLLLCLVLCTHFSFGQKSDTNRFIQEIQLGTNFASLIRNERVYFPMKNKYITTNPYVNLEGVFKFSPKFSIRIPIGYGLGNIGGKVIEGGSLPNHWFDTGPDNGPYAQAFPGWYNNGPRLDARSISQQAACNLRCTSRSPTFARPQDLKYQIGFFPKITFNKSEKIKISLTAGANFGYMDKYAISEYNSFTSIKNTAGDTNIGWIQTASKLIFESNPFFFVRGEYLLGLDFKISERMSLNFETGFAHFVYGHGKKPDKIYTNLDNKGFNLIKSDFENTDYFNRNRNQNDNSILDRVIPFYFINRFSLRYSIR